MEPDSLGIVGLVALFVPAMIPFVLLAVLMERLGIGFWPIAATTLVLGLLL